MADYNVDKQRCEGGACAACSHRDGCACPRAALAGRGNLQSYNWLKGINGGDANQLVEVIFKKTRKSYFLNTTNLQLKEGDAVVVEGSPGQDVGKVAMVGPLVAHQMRRANLRPDFEPKRIYRLANENDMERFRQARDREHDTMIRSRKIAAKLGLKMKIGDVEYQGDGHKAIFYYIADERVDFRKLIRILADTFGVRVEMKQIGARQEAGRIGGIGPCGRPLCCATFMTRFASVGTGSARLQDISMNPQKLAGQCAKLKCCLNFEVDTYMEAQRKMPPKDVVLETKEKEYHFFKADILKREISYMPEDGQTADMVTIPAGRAFEVMALNKRGIKPEQLAEEEEKPRPAAEFVELVGQDSLTRFDRKGRSRGGKRRTPANAEGQPRQNKQQRAPKGNVEGKKPERQLADKQPKQPKTQQPKPQQSKPQQPKPQQPKPQSKEQQPKPQQPKEYNRKQRPPKPKEAKQTLQPPQAQTSRQPVSQSAVRAARAQQETKNQ